MRWPSRRARIALFGSLLLHALLAALLLRQKPTPTPVAANPPVTVEIVELPAARPPTPVAVPAVPHSAPARPARTHRAIASAAVHSEVAVPAKPQAPHDDIAAVPPATHAPDLTAAAARAAERVDQTTLALNPFQPKTDDRGVQAPFVVADPNARVSSMIREGLARARVEHGLVDPYFTQLGEAMAGQWQAEKKVDEKGLKGFLHEMQRGLYEGASEYARAWAREAEAYGSTGTLPGAGARFDPQGRLTDNVPSGYSEMFPGEMRNTRIALVRLTQALDGRLLAVELIQPSIDPSMDAELLRELRGGSMKLPVPPTSGQGIHDPIRSIWAFQLIVSIAPPLPTMISGTFDLDAIFDKQVRKQLGGVADVRLPLSRRIFKHVQLVSVE